MNTNTETQWVEPEFRINQNGKLELLVPSDWPVEVQKKYAERVAADLQPRKLSTFEKVILVIGAVFLLTFLFEPLQAAEPKKSPAQIFDEIEKRKNQIIIDKGYCDEKTRRDLNYKLMAFNPYPYHRKEWEQLTLPNLVQMEKIIKKCKKDYKNRSKK